MLYSLTQRHMRELSRRHPSFCASPCQLCVISSRLTEQLPERYSETSTARVSLDNAEIATVVSLFTLELKLSHQVLLPKTPRRNEHLWISIWVLKDYNSIYFFISCLSLFLFNIIWSFIYLLNITNIKYHIYITTY